MKVNELERRSTWPYCTYSDIIQRYFLSLTAPLEQREYASNKIKSVTEALRELWLVEAEKGKTFEIFKDFETFEGFLFQSEDYRGHYVHQFDVFLLGFYILNKISERYTGPAPGPLVESFRLSINPNFTWMLAATFHDMGYPVEQIDRWFSRFLKMFLKVETSFQIEVEKILTPIFFEYLKYLSEEHYVLTTNKGAISSQPYVRDWEFHNILETNLLKKDHGVISSLLLIHSLLTQEKIKQLSNWFINTFPYEIMPACHAISIHNLEINDLRISLSKYPYAFLLILCDTLQDWQRSVKTLDYSELRAIEFNFPDNLPTIDFHLEIKDPRKCKELDRICNWLSTDGLMKIRISQENGDGFWEL